MSANFICPLCDQLIDGELTLIAHADNKHGSTPLPSLRWYVDHAAKLAALQDRLARAEKVVEAARRWHRYGADENLVAAFAEYDAIAANTGRKGK